MFITPITQINNINEISKVGQANNDKKTDDSVQLPFADIFSKALNDYKDAESNVQTDISELATGQSDDLHNLMINTKKSELALDLFVQLRNKSVEAYKELIGMGI